MNPQQVQDILERLARIERRLGIVSSGRGDDGGVGSGLVGGASSSAASSSSSTAAAAAMSAAMAAQRNSAAARRVESHVQQQDPDSSSASAAHVAAIAAAQAVFESSSSAAVSLPPPTSSMTPKRRRVRRLPLDGPRRKALRDLISGVESRLQEDESGPMVFDPSEACSSAHNAAYIRTVSRMVGELPEVIENLLDESQHDFTRDALDRIIKKRYRDRRSEHTRDTTKHERNRRRNRRIKRRSRQVEIYRSLLESDPDVLAVCQQQLAPGEFTVSQSQSGRALLADLVASDAESDSDQQGMIYRPPGYLSDKAQAIRRTLLEQRQKPQTSRVAAAIERPPLRAADRPEIFFALNDDAVRYLQMVRSKKSRARSEDEDEEEVDDDEEEEEEEDDDDGDDDDDDDDEDKESHGRVHKRRRVGERPNKRGM